VLTGVLTGLGSILAGVTLVACALAAIEARLFERRDLAG
jgi:hypothetical protein